jgi:hypothetical protein
MLSRVTVAKTRGLIRESLYWIFTSRKYNSYNLKIALIVAHVTSHTKSSNSSTGHTTVP